MRVLDLLFYLALCIVMVIAFFLHSPSNDLYFPVTQSNTQTNEVWEREYWESDIKNPTSLGIAQISDSQYLITFQSKDSNLHDNLYGVLFYPRKYTLKTSQKDWQNITVNTKSYTHAQILATKEMLFSQTKQYIKTFNTPLLHNIDSKLMLFVNANIKDNMKASRVHIFSANPSDILALFEDTKSNAQTYETLSHTDDQTDVLQKYNTQEKNTNNQLFTAHSKPILSLFANLNAFVAHKPAIIKIQDTENGFILPFFLQFNENTALFGVFDSQTHLKEVIKPHNNTYLSKPMITPIPSYYFLDAKNNNETQDSTRSCLALYHNTSQQATEKNKLFFQTCHVGNGVLQFDSITQSANVAIGDFLNINTFGNHIIALYTNPDNTTLHLALWDGQDFIPLKEVDKSRQDKIIDPSLLVHGEYAYILYGKEMQNTIHTITFNEAYINNLLNKNGIK